MEKIDRLGWADGFTIRCHGARIGVRVNDASVIDQVATRLPPGWLHAASPVVDALFSVIAHPPEQGNDSGGSERPSIKRFNLLYAGARRVARSLDLDAVLATLEMNLDAAVAERARHRLFVRAGVVAWRGRAIVIPTTLKSGITTLVSALVDAGALYFSDQYAVFDAKGRVHPFTRRVSLQAEKRVTDEDAERKSATRPVPVGLILLTEYQAGIRWQPSLLTPGQSVLALLARTVMERVAPEFALRVLERVCTGATTLAGARGEAQEMPAALVEHLAR